jgi:hypothetical protein
MHVIDNPNEQLPNGLDVADVNRDGFPDYVTNYEGGQGIIRVAFHPGDKSAFASLGLAARQMWPAVTVAQFPNAENAAFGDLDGDGAPDIAVAHGNQAGAGERSGVSIVWCQDPARVRAAAGWRNGGAVPGTVDRGHYLFIKTADVNGDGRLDIVVGGRREGSSATRAARDGPAKTGALAGLKWLEAPDGPPAQRRDLARWKVHAIDPDLTGGYGFRLGDVDRDGDLDVVVCNKDWDTPADQARVLWYEHPGSAPGQVQRPWRRHEIHDGTPFYTKTQIDLGDVTGDGRPDLVLQSEEHVYLFEQLPGPAVAWKPIKIAKPEITRFRTRPIRLQDLDGDGRLDIVGALIHNEGYLPTDKAAVFWMRFTGDRPTADNWTTHPIKWGDGFNGGHVFVGEKWDQFLFHDIDRDGDLDIVANVEEFHGRGPGEKVYLAVVWFENPGVRP